MKEEIFKLFEFINSTENYEEALVLWAEEKISKNIESESLILLAGLVKSEHNSAKGLFEKAVLELGYTIPSKEEILLSLTIKIAYDIVSNNLDANKGCKMLDKISVELDYPDILSIFNLLAHEQSGHKNIGIYPKDLIPEIKSAANNLLNLNNKNGITSKST